jgi:hypothetical protein
VHDTTCIVTVDELELGYELFQRLAAEVARQYLGTRLGGESCVIRAAAGDSAQREDQRGQESGLVPHGTRALHEMDQPNLSTSRAKPHAVSCPGRVPRHAAAGEVPSLDGSTLARRLFWSSP